jgi:hypothetical protein
VRTRLSQHVFRAAILCCALQVGAPVAASAGTLSRHTFYLEGGYFFGPGPIVPDTQLPDGELANIRFDVGRMSGYCEFANSGGRDSLLSDGRTRINQNIDAGRLLIGGGTSPILLTAIDGGPHNGTERYYLDDQYRFVWRVDIALDPGFPEGIIRLHDFVLTTGVVRIGRSLQTQRGEPGGYDQAGTLPAGTFLAGRVGDFDQNDRLDGILVAAPHVPLAADMLPGAPVGNRRGFSTDVPITANVSAELMLRGVMHLREPLSTTLAEADLPATRELARDLSERLRIVHATAKRALVEKRWRSRAGGDRLVARLLALRNQAAEVSHASDAAAASVQTQGALEELFASTYETIETVAALNASSATQLARPTGDLAAWEPRQKNY